MAVSALTERIGSYVVLDQLGHGSLSTVYLARQPKLHREVALKRVRLDPPDPTRARRFVDAARAATVLSHPNIVTALDCFEHDGIPYVVMERVAGTSLRPIVRTLTPAQAIGVLEQVLAALIHAEVQGVVHGDLHPGNVLVTRTGEVKLVDFGIARAYCAMSPPTVAVGTPAYMAPEQSLSRPIGPRTDLYSVGILAFEMLARTLPFGGAGSRPTVFARHIDDPIPSLGPRVEPMLDEWVRAMLAKQPAQRPSQASAAWTTLEEIAIRAAGDHWRFAAALGDGSPPEPVRSPTAGRTRRHVLAAATVAIAIGVALIALQRDPTSRAPRPERAVKRAPVAVIAKALAPLVEANKNLSRALESLNGPAPAQSAYELVTRARSATRAAARADLPPTFAPLLRTEKRHLEHVGDVLREPTASSLAASLSSGRRLRDWFVRVGSRNAPGGAASVSGMSNLAAWTQAQLRAARVPPARSSPGAGTVPTPEALPIPPPVPRPKLTATPEPDAPATVTPTVAPSPGGEASPAATVPTEQTPGTSAP